MPGLPPSLQVIERDWLSCNQVLLFDGEGADCRATLIDSGFAKHAQLTVELIRHALSRRQPEPVRLGTLINTHLHSDHCGGNAAIARAFGCRIVVPQAEFDAVNRWDEQALTFSATGQRCERFAADDMLRPGDRLTLGAAQWHALAAPGHDPHSLILHCPEHRLLISADALWGSGFGVIFPELSGSSGFAEQRAVLDLIESLDVVSVIPGHGPPFADVGAALRRARARLDALSADPARNARHAIKVLIKFQLLDRESVGFARLVDDLRDASIMADAAALMGMTLAQALEWGARELERQSQIRRDGDTLYNCEPAAAGAA